MSLRILFGPPGTGKSTYNTMLLIKEYWEQGFNLFADTCERIEELNKERINKLTLPDRPPIYADYKMELQIGYEEFFKPYFVDGYHLGLDNEDLEIIRIAPGSRVHLSEVQRYYDSRKSTNFPEWVSRFFEMHRHYGVDITMDIQRASLVDVNIRDLCKHYTEIQSMKHTLDDLGRIVHTKVTMREFGSYADVEDYVNNKSTRRKYDIVTDEYDGDIYECFESCTYFEKFVPADDKDFNFMEYGNNSIIEPKEFRHPDKKKKDNKAVAV